MIDIASQTRVDGQVAIVTGGGTGIGEACCEVLAAAGAHVVVAGRTDATITEVAKRVKGTAVNCDVSDFAQVEALFETAAKITGKVDILINNSHRWTEHPQPVETVMLAVPVPLHRSQMWISTPGAPVWK